MSSCCLVFMYPLYLASSSWQQHLYFTDNITLHAVKLYATQLLKKLKSAFLACFILSLPPPPPFHYHHDFHFLSCLLLLWQCKVGLLSGWWISLLCYFWPIFKVRGIQESTESKARESVDNTESKLYPRPPPPKYTHIPFLMKVNWTVVLLISLPFPSLHGMQRYSLS